MSNHPIARTILGAIFLLYPLMVYFGLRTFEPRYIALLFGVLAATRLLTLKSQDKTGNYWAIAALLAMGITLVSGSKYGLLFYPVFINVAFLSVFIISLINPPSTIERIARLQHPDLPDKAIPYTRKVTIVWCVFFVVNGLVALATIFMDEYWWMLYNGFVAYLLVAALLVGELFSRRLVMRQAND